MFSRSSGWSRSLINSIKLLVPDREENNMRLIAGLMLGFLLCVFLVFIGIPDFDPTAEFRHPAVERQRAAEKLHNVARSRARGGDSLTAARHTAQALKDVELSGSGGGTAACAAATRRLNAAAARGDEAALIEALADGIKYDCD